MSTAIEWTDETWNPVVGCDQVSPGCAHCYAKELHDKRHKAHLAGKDVAAQYAQPFEVVQLKPERLRAPLSWRKPRRVFVNSVADLFHESVPFYFIDDVLDIMRQASRHTFQVLTKRPARMLEWAFSTNARHGDILGAHTGQTPRPLPNVWLGVSVENQRFADERIPLLLQMPAAVRFLSCEPLLGPVDLERIGHWRGEPLSALEEVVGFVNRPRIDWVIVGGESGPKARPFDIQWAQSIVAQCKAAGIACFVKQLGSQPGFRLEDEERRGNMAPSFHHYDDRAQLYIKRLTDRKGGEPSEWPEELRVREFPAGAR